MSAIIAIICYNPESMKMFYFPSKIQEKMKDIKRQSICYIEFPNRIAARNHLALDLIEDKHMSREDRDNILAGKKREWEVNGLNISVRSDIEMKQFVDYYNKLP